MAAGVAGGSPAGPSKACTWFDDGASNSPSATVGVGKWFASEPSAKLCTMFPVAGSSAVERACPPMDHTSPPATMGGPPAPVLVCHSTCALLGAAVATATMPD